MTTLVRNDIPCIPGFGTEVLRKLKMLEASCQENKVLGQTNVLPVARDELWFHQSSCQVEPGIDMVATLWAAYSSREILTAMYQMQLIDMHTLLPNHMIGAEPRQSPRNILIGRSVSGEVRYLTVDVQVTEPSSLCTDRDAK